MAQGTKRADPLGVTHDELREAIRAVGLRATLQRIAVLGVLGRAKQPMSHAELCRQLVARADDRSTVYRNLMDLARVGLVRRVVLGGRGWQFEVARDVPHARAHPHFVCTSCGAVLCLPDCTIDVARVRGVRALRHSDYEVHVRGICDACAAEPAIP